MARGAASRSSRSARRAAARVTPTTASTSTSGSVSLDVLAARARGETMAASGRTDLPLSDRDAPWDAQAAKKSLDPAQYPDAFFWRDPDGDPATLAAYKLGFAKNDGGLTAVWRGVTASAAAIQGSRGGVDIPQADVPGVKSRIEKYYAAARKKYDDDSITVPWSADAESFHGGAAQALAYAEVGAAAADSDAGAAFAERAGYWDAFLNSTRCACGHQFSEHLGADGPCTHTDGRGECSCSSYQEMAVQASCECGGDACRCDALTAAVGDVAFGPEDGFRDLIADVNDQLEDAAADQMMMCQYKAIDAAVDLTRVVIRDWDGDQFWVAPITMVDGDPVLSTPDQWVPAEKGLVEVAPDDDEPDDGNPAAMMAAAGVIEAPAGGVESIPTGTTAADAYAGLRWEATLVPEGIETDDGRMFAEGSVSWRDLPLTLMAQMETQPGHDGALVAGRIDRIWREGNLIRAEGVFDQSEFGRDVARMVGEGVLRGVSVDVAVRQSEVVQKNPSDDGSEPDLLDLLFGGEDVVYVVQEGVIGAVTVCSFPAFADASIALTASGAVWRLTHQGGITVVRDGADAAEVLPGPDTGTPAVPAGGVPDPIVAAAPVAPPSAWFRDPELAELTPLVVTDDGRVYGHLAAWGVCHIGFPDACVTAPHSRSGNAYFHLGEIQCDDGRRFAIGKITMGTGHADAKSGWKAAVDHYDNTGTVAADVISGEDPHGIWVAGAVRPGITDAQVRELRAAVLSGDWRAVNGHLELVAALAVNVPGFPVPRPRALVACADGPPEPLTLVAAGMHRGVPDDAAARARLAELAVRASAPARLRELAARARGE